MLAGRQTDRQKLRHCEALFAGFNIGNHRSNLIRFSNGKTRGRLLRSINPFNTIKLKPRNEEYGFSAFTLAEVLITLGIIGVVAAMTIPTLINNAKDRELKSAFKKRYSEISQAFTKMRIDNGGTLDGLFEGSNYATPNVMNPVILEYFKVVRNDWTANSAGNTVWHDPNTYYYMDNSKCTSTCGGCAGYILSDGSMMYTSSDNVNTCNSYSIPNLCMMLNIDVNGFKKPNVVGRDIFMLYVYKDKVVPPDALLPGSILDTNARLNNCAPAYLGGGCARQYLLE